MTRVVSGTHRGRTLLTPRGTLTRPTSDRAREGLFSSLLSLLDLEGARVLDLYAGSGALGLEALSRGALEATLVDSDERALAALRANVAALGVTARVVGQPVEQFLAAGPPEPYDLVLLDPPYALDVDAVLPSVVPWAADVVVVERRTGEPLTWPDGLQAVRARRYGEATLWYGSRS